jgi:hypothetical protein
MPLPTRAVAKANAAGSTQGMTPGTIASKALIPSLCPLSECKAVTDNNVLDRSPGTVKSDPKESDEESQLQGEGSLLELIASTRKALFERPPPTDEDQTVNTTKSQKWVPIKKSGSNTNKDTGTSWRGCKAVSFVADTNFMTRETAPVKKTPAKEAATKVNECVVKL